MNRSGQESFVHTLNFPAVSLFASQVVEAAMGNIGRAACVCSFAPLARFLKTQNLSVITLQPLTSLYSLLEREVV